MMNNTKDNTAAIILAAGQGTRMKSSQPKVMHKIAGKPMIHHLIDRCINADIQSIIPVISPSMHDSGLTFAPHQSVIQKQQNGTGDAVKAAKEALKDFKGFIFILNGDGPFITPETLHNLKNSAQKTGLAILGCEWPDPYGYGRFILDGDYVDHIVEEKDCTDQQRQIRLGNTGVYCVSSDYLFDWIDQLSTNNAQGEYYLTDIISIANKAGVPCAYTVGDPHEVMGINSKEQLAMAEQFMQRQLRKAAMDHGVTMIDPQSVTLAMDTQFESDVVIEPNVFIGPGVSVGHGTHIHAFSHIEGTVIGSNASIGPFARLRPKSKIGHNVSIGNFSEVNRSEFKDGSKSKHLSYIGDAVIGEKTNIGAGTVFANYDGFNKNLSDIGSGTFIGSNTTIVSPVKIGDGAMIAAGSTITTNIDANALAVAREKEIIRDGWALQYREKNKKG